MKSSNFARPLPVPCPPELLFDFHNCVLFLPLFAGLNDLGRFPDLSKEGNHVTPTDISFVDGTIGRSPSFNGTSSKMVRAGAASASLAFTADSWTTAFVLNILETVNDGYIIRKGTLSSGGWALFVDETTDKVFFYTFKNGGNVFSNSIDISGYFGRNLLLVATHTYVDGTTNQVRFYLDGRDITEVGNNHVTAEASASDFIIGLYSNPKFFSGILSFVGVWKGAWSVDQISQWSNRWKRYI